MKRMFSTVFRFAVFVLASAVVVAQDLKYIEHDTDFISPATYRARRQKLMQEIGNDAVAIFYAAPERFRNGDVEYQYRQDDNFYYLTGFTEPNAILVLNSRGINVQNPEDTTKMISVNEILYVQPRNPTRETWTGRRYGPAGAMMLRGLQYAETNDRFESRLRGLTFSPGLKYLYLPTFRSDFSGEIADLMRPLRSMLDQISTRVELRDPTPTVRKMRIVKSPEEIAIIAKATQISALAHNQAMMSCEPGMYEYELQGLYEYVFRRMGAEYAGYPCIVGAAENSVTLHYNSDRRGIHDGDIVLSDCAAEYHGYSSDVTRTYPANGKFSPAQKSIYEIVLDAQKAAMSLLKPGVNWIEVSQKATQVIEDGLFKLGIIKEKNGREYRRFFMHGLGHPVGLDVHDVGQPTLEAGMIYTVEPGIYIAEGSEGVDPSYYNIGVRIEDTVLITPDGYKNLSADSPREISDIESLMKEKGIGNQPVR